MYLPAPPSVVLHVLVVLLLGHLDGQHQVLQFLGVGHFLFGRVLVDPSRAHFVERGLVVGGEGGVLLGAAAARVLARGFRGVIRIVFVQVVEDNLGFGRLLGWLVGRVLGWRFLGGRGFQRSGRLFRRFHCSDFLPCFNNPILHLFLLHQTNPLLLLLLLLPSPPLHLPFLPTILPLILQYHIDLILAIHRLLQLHHQHLDIGSPGIQNILLIQHIKLSNQMFDLF